MIRSVILLLLDHVLSIVLYYFKSEFPPPFFGKLLALLSSLVRPDYNLVVAALTIVFSRNNDFDALKQVKVFLGGRVMWKFSKLGMTIFSFLTPFFFLPFFFVAVLGSFICITHSRYCVVFNNWIHLGIKRLWTFPFS